MDFWMWWNNILQAINEWLKKHKPKPHPHKKDKIHRVDYIVA